MSDYNRMNMRRQNKKFRRFINMTQLMIFSNNNPYDNTESIPLEGAFYAQQLMKNCFLVILKQCDTILFGVTLLF